MCLCRQKAARSGATTAPSGLTERQLKAGWSTADLE